MKRIYFYCLSIVIALLLQNCDLVDFTDVNNPNVTEDVFIGLESAPEETLAGLERQMAQTLNRNIEFGEILSDNYFNNRSLSSKVFDKLTILDSDQDVRYFQQQIHALRELALLGIEKVLPAHPTTDENIVGEYYFFKGMSELFAGEYFTYFPVSVSGEIVSSQQILQLAIEDFDIAISKSSDDEKLTSYKIAKLRALYNLGNTNKALELANELASKNMNFYRSAAYDGLNGLNNSFQFYLFDSEQDEFAPLPSLDFLDPKFFNLGSPTTEQHEVAYLKMEEVYLVKAEAELASSNIPEAKTVLKTLLKIVDARPKVNLDDSRETRSGGNRESFFSTDRGSYPLTADYVVSFAGDDKEYTNLILDRQEGDIIAHPISGTSVSDAVIDEALSEDEVLYLIYKMRQEIFISEARRVIDLGIKLPIADFEAISNTNVTSEHLVAQIPDFISNLDLSGYPLDNFTNDLINKKITIDYDFNKFLVNNKNTSEVVPFF
ncbi:hypothetical protein [Marinifilum sp.]|uniref:hypothetical protein n=1 Tax=Marinifilum sp. TaxID=2033137 RepID=UPI003BADBE70